MLDTTSKISNPTKRKGQLSKEEAYKQRVFLIQDAISGLGYQMSAPETVIFPFVDYLAVLLQKGRVISIWNGQTNEMIFSSLGDQALIAQHGELRPQVERVTLWNSPYEIQVDDLNGRRYGANGTGKPKDAYEVQLQPDYEMIREVLSHFDEISAQHPDTAFSHKLIDAISSYKRLSHTQPAASNLKLKEIDDLLKPMGSLLDEVFFDLRQSHVFQVIWEGAELVKLFAVVRTVPSAMPRYNGFFNYTASLLLSDSQNGALLKLLNEEYGAQEAQQWMKFLKSPLGLNDRSVADTVFSSGNVGFGGKVGRELDVAQDESAQMRQQVENFVYKKIHQIDEEDNLHVFYVPVHVGGVPWLAFFTFTDKLPMQDHEAWKRNYRIYRDVIPKITSQIRTGAKDIYLRLLSDKLTSHLHSWKIGSYPLEELARRVSEDWQKINQVYPYDRVQLKVVETGRAYQGDMMLNLGDGRRVVIDVEEGSTFLKRDVRYDLLNKDRVKRACDSAMQRYIQVTDSLQKQAAAYNTHNLKNPLYRLKNILESTDLADEPRAAMNGQINELIALERFSNYLITGKSDSKPVFKTSGGKSFPELKATVDNALGILGLNAYQTNSADTLHRIEERRALTLDFDALEDIDGSTIVFCAEQMNVVSNGLISNALKYNHLQLPALAIWASVDRDGVYLNVRNPASEPAAELRELARDLSNPTDMYLNFVGINLIHLACHACRYLPPGWKEDGGNLVATVRVASRTTS